MRKKLKQKLIKLQGKISNRSNPTPLDRSTEQSQNEVTCCATCHCTFVNFDAKDVINCNLCRDIKRLAGGYKNVEISDPEETTWKVKDEDGEILESCTTEACVDSVICPDCEEHEDDCVCDNCDDCGCYECECTRCDECGYLDEFCECVICDNCDERNCEECVRCEWCDGYECECITCIYCDDILRDDDGIMYACECEDIVVP